MSELLDDNKDLNTDKVTKDNFIKQYIFDKRDITFNQCIDVFKELNLSQYQQVLRHAFGLTSFTNGWNMINRCDCVKPSNSKSIGTITGPNGLHLSIFVTEKDKNHGQVHLHTKVGNTSDIKNISNILSLDFVKASIAATLN